MVKYSKQRDAILKQLSGRTDHPTAETLYRELKEIMPNLSIATVYRNLKQMETWGLIKTVSSEGATRYDPDVNPHSHFFCTTCGNVMDLDQDNGEVIRMGQKRFAGEITSCVSNYYGKCPRCAGNQASKEA